MGITLYHLFLGSSYTVHCLKMFLVADLAAEYRRAELTVNLGWVVNVAGVSGKRLSTRQNFTASGGQAWAGGLQMDTVDVFFQSKLGVETFVAKVTVY